MSDNVGEITAQEQRRGMLISLLQQAQERDGYVSSEAMKEIGRAAGISPNIVFGVTTFYAQFRLAPRGKHTMKVCLGTACHVRGAERILDAVERKIGIKPGETTLDRQFSLERVACFGSCALAPVMVVDEEDVYGRVTTSDVEKVVTKYQGEAQ